MSIVGEEMKLIVRGPTNRWLSIALSNDAFMPGSLAFVLSGGDRSLSVRKMDSRSTPGEVNIDGIDMNLIDEGFVVTLPIFRAKMSKVFKDNFLGIPKITTNK